MVTICNASLTFSNSTFCPYSVFMCFVWIWEQTAIISLYSINRLVFITETECVYCTVRTGYLCTIPINFSLYMPVIAKTLFRSKVHPYGIFGGLSVPGMGFFFPKYYCFPCQYKIHRYSIFIFFYVLLLPEKQTGEAKEASKKHCFFENGEALDWKLLSSLSPLMG